MTTPQPSPVDSLALWQLSLELVLNVDLSGHSVAQMVEIAQEHIAELEAEASGDEDPETSCQPAQALRAVLQKCPEPGLVKPAGLH